MTSCCHFERWVWAMRHSRAMQATPGSGVRGESERETTRIYINTTATDRGLACGINARWNPLQDCHSGSPHDSAGAEEPWTRARRRTWIDRLFLMTMMTGGHLLLLTPMLMLPLIPSRRLCPALDHSSLPCSAGVEQTAREDHSIQMCLWSMVHRHHCCHPELVSLLLLSLPVAAVPRLYFCCCC